MDLQPIINECDKFLERLVADGSLAEPLKDDDFLMGVVSGWLIRNYGKDVARSVLFEMGRQQEEYEKEHTDEVK